MTSDPNPEATTMPLTNRFPLAVVFLCILIVLTGCSGGAPSEELLRSTIIASIEEGGVPREIRGAMMTGSCADGNVKKLAIRGVGEEQKRAGKTYWPVKVRVTGSCTQNFNCGPDNIMGECDTVTFDGEEAEFGVWKDPYGDWKAEVMR